MRAGRNCNKRFSRSCKYLWPIRLTFFVAVFLTTLMGCNNTKKIDNHQAPNHGNIIYATKFRIEKTESYTRIEITEPWQGSTGVSFSYYLVNRDSALPADIPDNGKVISVPVEKIICMSATHVAMIASLGMEHTIAGVSGIDLIYNDKVRELIRQELITEVGYEESLNREAVLRLRPDIFMAYGVGGESTGYLAKLSGLGINVMMNAEYLEMEPLGKAEWIKVYGALYCQEERADSLFNAAVEEYEIVKNKIIAGATSRPKVLLGLPWKDTWYISPGNSFISRLVGDAGGDYLWADKNSDISMPMSLENVFIKAMEATYWLNAGTAKSLNDIVVTDPRLAGLDVFKVGNLYNNNKLLTGTGANDYWERGTTNPGIILKDLGIILHPEIFPGDTLSFYTRLR
jgi:iron complex transport system substrate-binding protein